MFIVYDLIFLIFALISLPVYLLRGKLNRSFFSRLGFLPAGLKLNRPIWIHAVSVGEVKAVAGLVEGLRKKYPGKKFVISTVTPTGNKVARGIIKEGDLLIYLPLDISFIISRVVDKINPLLFILTETEIWPNLLSCLYRRKIPVVTVNGRISDSSFRGYSLIKFLIKPILGKITLFCMQSKIDGQRIERLGVDKERIRVTGNMKFDLSLNLSAGINSPHYRQKLGLKFQDKLLVAGSTHKGEDEVIINAYKCLLRDFPELKLLIAPRHPERSRSVGQCIIKNSFTPVYISEISASPGAEIKNSVFVLDLIGELANFYKIADIVFMGGSLVRKGGQNILEPASLGKPVLFGPHMFNFRDISRVFLKNKAAVMVRNGDELAVKIKELLSDCKQAEEMSSRGMSLISENAGATERNLELIRKFIEE